MSLLLIAERIGETLIEEIRNQILLQGHYMTGALSKSVEAKTEVVADGVIIRFLLNSYGLPVNNGVIPSRIPFGKPTGAKVSKYIQGLIRFAKIRFRVTEKEAKGIAFAIARKQVKEGMPTNGSYRFTKTGKRTDFLEQAVIKEMPEIVRLLGELEFDFKTMFEKI